MKLTDLEQMETEYATRGYRVAFESFHSTDRTDGEERWAQEELTKDDGNGWPTAEEAVTMAERLVKVGGKTIRKVRVLGPDLEPIERSWQPDTFPASAAAAESSLPAAAPTPADFSPASPHLMEPAATMLRREFGKNDANPHRLAGGEDLTHLGKADEAELISHLGPDYDTLPEFAPDARQAVDGIPASGTVLAEQDGICLVGDSNAQVYACPKEAVLGKPGYSWKPKVKRFENVLMGPGSDGRGKGAEIPWLTWAGNGVSVRAAFHSASGMWFVRR